MFNFELLAGDAPEGTEPIKVKADSRDVLLWERATKGASLSRLHEQMKMGDLYGLAWWACKRQRLAAGSLDLQDFEMEYLIEFEVEEVESDDSTGEVDPTQ